MSGSSLGDIYVGGLHILYKVENVNDLLSVCVCLCLCACVRVCVPVHVEALTQTTSMWTLNPLAEGGASKIWAGRQGVWSQAHT